MKYSLHILSKISYIIIYLAIKHVQKFPERKPDLLFKDEQSSKTLEMLLKSKHPDDLQAANRLIKLMVKQVEHTRHSTTFALN